MKLVIAVTTQGDYRDNFFDALTLRFPSLRIMAGSEFFYPSAQLSPYVASLPNTSVVANHYLLGRRLNWQSLNWRESLGCDVAVVEFNPRVLSAWFLLVTRRLKGRRTLVWGHAWARSGPMSVTEPVRRLMLLLAHGAILYTHSQRGELLQRYPKLAPKLFVAPNALYPRAMFRSAYPAEGRPKNFIFVGRMVEDKKPRLLLDAFERFSRNHPDSKLHMVGSGELLEGLSARYASEKVVFHGHLVAPSDLLSLYTGAVASVSPGYVGLSITQSLSFGVPMIVARNEQHAPEIECLVEGFNGTFFNSDDVEDLANVMAAWYDSPLLSPAHSQKIMERCRADYSVERMVEGYVEAVEAY